MTPATSAVRRHSGIGPGTEPLDSKGAKVTLTAEAAESASGRFGELRAAAGIVCAADLRLGSTSMPHTTPTTYMAPNGKQYVVVVTTGVNAFALE
jgi:hypothetical protein